MSSDQFSVPVLVPVDSPHQEDVAVLDVLTQTPASARQPRPSQSS